MSNLSQNSDSEDKTERVFLGGMFFGILIGVMIILGGMFHFGYHFEKDIDYPSMKSFTVIDKDEGDGTFYTSDGEILTTNKYQLKRLELNHTYYCDSWFAYGVSGCTDVEV